MGNSQTETLALTLKISNLNLGLALLTERGQIRQGRTFEVNKLFIIWLFALVLWARNRSVGITVG